MPPTLNDRATIPAKTNNLIDYAHSRGIRVEWALDLPERGRYIPALNLIVLRHGMTEARTVSTLAHELGHAYYGDWCSAPGAEARAWKYAARLLVPESRLAHLETVYDTSGEIARELGVTTDLLAAYLTP